MLLFLLCLLTLTTAGTLWSAFDDHEGHGWVELTVATWIITLPIAFLLPSWSPDNSLILPFFLAWAAAITVLNALWAKRLFRTRRSRLLAFAIIQVVPAVLVIRAL